MSAEVYEFSRAAKVHRRPLLITFNSEKHRCLTIPDALRYIEAGETWMEYSNRLWLGVYYATGDDTFEMTVHLKLSESHRLIHELKQWAFYASRIDGGALIEPVAEEIKKLRLHGVRFAFDVPEGL